MDNITPIVDETDNSEDIPELAQGDAKEAEAPSVDAMTNPNLYRTSDTSSTTTTTFSIYGFNSYRRTDITYSVQDSDEIP